MKPSRQPTLRDDLRRHYGKKKLEDARLSQLLAMADVVEEPTPSSTDSEPAEDLRPSGGVGQRVWMAVLASAALVALLVVPWMRSSWQSQVSTEQLASRVAEEIAMNHSKGLDVEYATGDLAELRRHMHKLDFALVDSQRLREQGLTLVGGRYCSIQGRLAAQLSLQTADGDAVTLYQTALIDDLAGLPEHPEGTRGLRIELWNEEGVFFGLARSP